MLVFSVEIVAYRPSLIPFSVYIDRILFSFLCAFVYVSISIPMFSSYSHKRSALKKKCQKLYGTQTTGVGIKEWGEWKKTQMASNRGEIIRAYKLTALNYIRLD